MAALWHRAIIRAAAATAAEIGGSPDAPEGLWDAATETGALTHNGPGCAAPQLMTSEE